MSGRPVLTTEEIKALAAAGSEAVAVPAQTWFFVRAGFCVAFVTANVLSLSLFFDAVFGKFDLPAQTLSILSAYVALRIALAVALVPLYFVSYFKRVFFVQLSFGCILLMLANLMNDYILIYSNMRSEALVSVAIMIFLRLVVMTLLLINVRFYQRAHR